MKSSDKVGTICRALRRAIIEQALEPGAKLPEDALGERFGVSRTIARYALGQLASEGLVELRRNRIAVVVTPSWDEARDAFDIRMELERLVVRQVAGRLSKSQIARLTAHVESEAVARDGPNPVSIRLATEFHILLATMTNSAILVRYVSEIAYRCCLTLSLYSRPHSSECAISEHLEIIGALEQGDADKAMSLMHSHLDSVANRALVVPPPTRGRDLQEVLAPYTDEAMGDDIGARSIAGAKRANGIAGSGFPHAGEDASLDNAGGGSTSAQSASKQSASKPSASKKERRIAPRSGSRRLRG